LCQHLVANGVQQVTFAESNATVDKEWIVGDGRIIGNRHGSSVCELVSGSADKLIKGVTRVKWGAITIRLDWLDIFAGFLSGSFADLILQRQGD